MSDGSCQIEAPMGVLVCERPDGHTDLHYDWANGVWWALRSERGAAPDA